MQDKTIIAIFITLFSFSFTVTGQKMVNSPYARFNLGIIEPSASFRSLGMGGTAVGIRSSNSIYFANPASYTAIDTNSFIFDFGVDYGLNKLSNGSKDFTSEDMNFSHLIMGFPLSKRVGFAFGIVPYSNGYYKLSETVIEGDAKYDPLVGSYNSVHNGNGGLNNLFIGTGFKIIKNLSAGVNMSILFGQINRTYMISFSDYTNAYNNNATERLKMSGVNFDYGLLYSKPLKNDYYLNIGASLTPGKNIKTDYEQLSYKYTIYSTADTLSYVSDDSTKTFIPGTLRLGISFGKKNKFTAGLDYVTTKWSKAKLPGLTGYAADTRNLRLGIEYIPDKYSNYNLLKRFEYRIGGHVGDNYLKINGEQIKEYGASFGLGIPLRRTFSRANFFFDYTRKSGSGSSITHIEDYFTMGLSLNLYDFWFIKRKYD